MRDDGVGRAARCVARLAAIGVMLLAASLPSASPRAQSALPPLRMALQAEGWTEMSADPQVWRCGACEPVVVATFAQRDDAWPDMPADIRTLHGSVFTRRVLADAEQRRALLDGILREVNAMAPGLKAEASLVGPRTIGAFEFVEARVVARYGRGGLTAATAFLTFHRGWLIQVTMMYGVADLPTPAVRQIGRFLEGASFHE